MDERRDRPLRRSDLHDDPLAQFLRWFEEARASAAPMPEAVALATAAPDGAPSARIVLLKRVDERGFVVATNLESRKARELAANPRVALLFHWYELGRQVRVEGHAERTSPDESDALHRDRPRASRLAAWSSRQSEPIASRDVLDAEYAAREREFDGVDVPLPPFWGGIRIVAGAYEFWQHREDRLHDRFRYGREGAAWRVDRLAP